ncbi:type II secretion system protein [Dielma fastidiosa]|uniref:type II secretion system protein n=1 Tax=Dielma fastidiosa TaxID=1034346 RepID=UPI003569EC8F
MKNLKNKKGFTLIELIVVIAILGILALFLVPQFMGYSQDAKVQVAKANTRTVWTAANAALTQSEYDENIKVTANGTAGAGETGIKDVALDKLGDSFKATLTMTIDVTDKKVTEVVYDGCSYDGETFGADCGK